MPTVSVSVYRFDAQGDGVLVADFMRCEKSGLLVWKRATSDCGRVIGADVAKNKQPKHGYGIAMTLHLDNIMLPGMSCHGGDGAEHGESSGTPVPRVTPAPGNN